MSDYAALIDLRVCCPPVSVRTAVVSSFRFGGIGFHRVWIVGLLRQCGGRLAHVELAGHDIGDEARTVLAEEVDFTARISDTLADLGCGPVDKADNERLLILRRNGNGKCP